MNQKGNIVYILVISILVVSLLVLAMYKFNPYSIKNSVSQTVLETDIQPVVTPQKERSSKLFLERNFLNFDGSLSELPNFSDIRSVDQYNDHLIITGYSKIIEYNPKDKTYVRISNNLIPNVNSAALIGSNLYISSDRPTNISSDFPPKRQIYVVDLLSGEIIKTYFESDAKRYANLMLISKDGLLWGSSWEGVFKMDPKNDQMTVYNHQQLLVSGESCPSGLFIEDNKIHVLQCGSSFSVYDEKNDKWTYRQEKFPGEYASKINKHSVDFGLDLPNFFAVSQKLGDKYYLFSDIGIYTVEKNSLPQLFVKSKLVGGSVSLTLVTKDQKQAIIVSSLQGMIVDNILEDRLRVTLIDLKNGESFNLVQIDPGAKKELTESQELLVESLNTPSQLKINENSDGAEVIQSDAGKKLMSINIPNKKLTFY